MTYFSTCNEIFKFYMIKFHIFNKLWCLLSYNIMSVCALDYYHITVTG